MMEHLPKATRTLIISCIIIYISQVILDIFTHNFFSLFFGLSRIGVIYDHYIWQVITYAFLHGSPIHIALNMLGLYFIGPSVEYYLGSRKFYILYFLSAIFGALLWLLIGAQGLCIGASGAVFGVIGAFAALFPHQRLMLLLFFVLPINIQAWQLAVGLISLDLLFFLINPMGGSIAYIVHVGGGLTGVIYALLIKWRDARPLGR